MAKKHFGRFLTFAAIAGAAAAGISYFLQYKSFHKELDEDFHDFEDDFDDFEDTEETDGAAARNYVSLTPEKKAEDACPEDTGADADADPSVTAKLSGADSADMTAGQADIAHEAGDEGTEENGVEAETAADGDISGKAGEEAPSPLSDTTVTVEEITE